jgi:hypothetical protein
MNGLYKMIFLSPTGSCDRRGFLANRCPSALIERRYRTIAEVSEWIQIIQPGVAGPNRTGEEWLRRVKVETDYRVTGFEEAV